jgi:L-fucose isomerase-like protein
VDPETVNHDQQITHNIHLYLTIKIEDQWEKLQDIFGYNIYDVDLENILNKEEEERKVEEARIKEEEEKKKKEAAEKVMEKHRKKIGHK